MQCGRPPHCAPALTTARDSKGHLEPSPGLEPLEYPFLENRFSPCGLGISPHQRRRLSLCSSKPQARRIHPFPGFPCLTPHTAKQDGGVCECVCEREQRGSPPRPRVYECASIRVHVGGSTRGTGTDSAEPPRVSVCECAWGEHARHRHRQRGAPHRGRRRAGQVPGRPPTMPPAGPPPPLPTDLAPVLAPAHVGHGRPVSPPPCARAAWAHGRHSSCPFLLSPPAPLLRVTTRCTSSPFSSNIRLPRFCAHLPPRVDAVRLTQTSPTPLSLHPRYSSTSGLEERNARRKETRRLSTTKGRDHCLGRPRASRPGPGTHVRTLGTRGQQTPSCQKKPRVPA